jgi:hypothetical protein
MTTRSSVVLGVAAGLLSTGPAWAEPQGNDQPPSINVPVPQPPPADQPLIQEIPTPHALSVEGGAGLLGYISGTGRLGPAWNVRVSGALSPRFAVEANYVGAANRRSDDTGTLTYTTLDAGVRYNLLLSDQAPVQPYLSAGAGYAAWIGPGGAPAGLVMPVSVGVERLLTPEIKIGARFQLRPSFFEDLGHPDQRNPPGGSTWALIAGAGGAF